MTPATMQQDIGHLSCTIVGDQDIAFEELISPRFQWRLNGPPAGNGWYSLVDNGAFGADYIIRTAIAKSNMYENGYNETKHIFTDNDSDGKPLNGNNSYSVTFPAGQLPAVNGFWSMTPYNEHHFFNPNPLRRFSVGTKNKNLQTNSDGSLTLYAAAKSPSKDKETNWLPAPSTPFSLYIRCYWPKPEVINATWATPKVVEDRIRGGYWVDWRRPNIRQVCQDWLLVERVGWAALVDFTTVDC